MQHNCSKLKADGADPGTETLQTVRVSSVMSCLLQRLSYLFNIVGNVPQLPSTPFVGPQGSLRAMNKLVARPSAMEALSPTVLRELCRAGFPKLAVVQGMRLTSPTDKISR